MQILGVQTQTEQVSPLFEQIVVTVSAMGVKPLHMVLTAVLIAWLWRSKTADLVLIRRALLVFLLGETCCAIEFLFFGGRQEALELAHGVGMVGFGALLTWGFYRLVDERIVRFTAPGKPCSVQRLCGRCWKRRDVPCGLHRLSLVAVGAMVFIALMPLGTEVEAWDQVRTIFGAETAFWASDSARLLELRGYPIAAALLFAVAFVFLVRGRKGMKAAELPLFAGLGFFLFSATRFVLRAGFAEHPPWADAWEEITELMTVGGVAIMLLTFREQLRLPWRTRTVRKS